MPQTRSLAAIMFTDIVGYTKLMGENEQWAFEILRRNRELQRPLIEAHHGKWLKEIGDGVLASFTSVSDAVYGAIAIQEACLDDPELKIRIGIHLGEVVFEGEDVFGDGVNIASRLEPFAPEGGILISESVQRNIENKDRIRTQYFKKLELKNVRHPVNTYLVQGDDEEPAQKGLSQVNVKDKFLRLAIPLFLLTGLVLAVLFLIPGSHNQSISTPHEASTKQDYRSIAVLPFANMSNDPEQEYFSDGMMEEILNHLVKMGELKVTSRTSSMQYKQTDKSLKEIAAELGVSHILEGSVRKAGDRVRITTQLIDAQQDQHLWSESYDREFTDVFSIQSEVAQRVASSLNIELLPTVLASIDQVPTQNMEAYQLYLKAMANFQNINSSNMSRQIEWLNQAIRLDSTFSTAYALLGNSIIFKAGFSGETSSKEIAQEAKIALEKALLLNPLDAIAHSMMGAYYLWYEHDFSRAKIEYLTAQKLAPSDTRCLAFSIDMSMAAGQYAKAVETGEQLTKLENIPVNWARSSLARSFAGDIVGMQETIQKAKMADSSNILAYTEVARAYLIQKQFEKIPGTLDLSSDSKTIPRGMALLSIAYEKTGEVEFSNQWLDILLERVKLGSGGSPSFYTAMIYASRGETESAFQWLDKSFQDNEIELYWLKVEPEFASLHSDARWQGMLDRIGFP